MFQKKGRANKFCRRWRAVLGGAISGKPGGGPGYSRRWEWLTPGRLWSACSFWPVLRRRLIRHCSRKARPGRHLPERLNDAKKMNDRFMVLVPSRRLRPIGVRAAASMSQGCWESAPLAPDVKVKPACSWNPRG
jgi:hypothetical protein